MSGHVLLGIFPHPDDESYAAGGTLALAAQAGVRVEMLCLTRGEHGHHLHRSEADARSLDQVRADELACACAALGAQAPHLLDYPDGGLAGVNFPHVVAEIVRVIRSVRPQVVVALGPEGVYGHPDHVALYRLVIAASGAAAGGGRFPEGELGAAHRLDRLFLCAFPPGLFRPQYDKMLESDLAAAVRLVDPSRLGVPEHELAATIAIPSVAERKLAALACHRSQYEGDDPRAIFPAGIVDALLERESFTLVGGRPNQGPLSDLFEGLP